MKKVLLVMTLVSMSLISAAQFVVSPALSDAIKDGNAEYLDVNVYFENAESVSDLAQQFDRYHADFDTRVKGVTAMLKRNHERSYAKFMHQIASLMKANPSAVAEMEDFWIVNAVNMKVQRDFVMQIAGFENVTYIDLNTPRYTIVDGTTLVEENAPRSVNGVEWGVRAINAPAMWTLGYTGRNMLMLSIDTGVNPEHPAISTNYAGNHWPQSQCWYGMRHEDPRDNASSSHGTHTTGTVMGLDRATHDTIGIAFNAKWIACDPVASTNSELLTVSQFFAVYEWVLNPDGDENTTIDVPRVINNSWGYSYDIAEDFGACSLPENSIVETLEAAGICSPFSAGNEGPNESTIGYPAMLAYNVVNPMSVAAVNSSNIVANFSSRGPTPCVDEESSLKIKPEVSAPGVNVRSCVGFDGYNALQGTSMACPHVSGALLLLAEAFQMASARELKEALYYSAIDLGDEGEDNTYGMGMIDVLAAYNYLSNIYPVSAPETENFDISVKLVMSYGDGIVDYDTVTCVESVPTVYAQVFNDGNYDSGHTMLRIYSGDSLIASHDFEDVSHLAEVPYEYEVPNVPVHGGLNELYAVVYPGSNGIEYDDFNNSAMLRFKKYYESEFPLNIDFEEGGTFSNFGLIIDNPDNKKTWMIMPWGENSEHHALGCAFSKNNTYRDIDYAYLPRTNLPDEDSLYLNFIYAYKRHSSNSIKDSLFVEVSTDCGQTFPYMVWANGGPGLYTQEGNSGSYYVPADYSEFDTVSISLEEFRGQDVLIRLKSKNGSNSELYISKLSLDNHCLSGVREHSGDDYATMLQVYPNPTDGLVNIFIPAEYCGQNFCIYDVYGKIIKSFVVDNQYYSIDVSTQADGVYFLRCDAVNAQAKIVLLKK
ncbi:MAG: S8 family peptidase [Bacteroidales bacterium]|nr:S8 family peptidase [Bacteroidales bacterium]